MTSHSGPLQCLQHPPTPPGLSCLFLRVPRDALTGLRNKMPRCRGYTGGLNKRKRFCALGRPLRTRAVAGSHAEGKGTPLPPLCNIFHSGTEAVWPVLSIWRTYEENTSSHMSLQHLVSPGPRRESVRSSLGDMGSIQTLFSLWIIETLVLHLSARLSLRGRGAHGAIQCPLQKGLLW